MEALTDLFSMQGRANRAWYFWHVLLDDVVMFTMILVLALLGGFGLGALVLLPMLGVMVAGFWAGVCITVKRLHDIGRPGHHFLLLMIPLFNIYLGLVLLFRKGTVGPNAYGRDPLQAAKIGALDELGT